MRVLKSSELVIFVSITLLIILIGCNSRSARKEEPFNVTPLHFEVDTTIVTISDILNLEDLKIYSGDLFDYSIYLYVRPMNKPDWIRQGPAAAALKWVAQADLDDLDVEYGSEIHMFVSSPHLPIKNGEGFQIIAVLVKQSSSEMLPQHVESLGALRKLEGVHIISEVRTAIFRQK